MMKDSASDPNRRPCRLCRAGSFLSILMLATSVFARPPAYAAPTCADDPQAMTRLDLVEQAYNDLTLLYFEPLVPAAVLTPARDAIAATRSDDQPSDLVSDWMVFQDQFCVLWPAEATETSSDRLAYAAIEAMVEATHEPHTQFYTPQLYAELQQAEAGDVHYGGIGAEVRSDPLRIGRVYTGTPAEQAGLQLGDRIVAIDGTPTTDMLASDAVDLIRGEEGTTVDLTILRPGSPGTRDVQVRRAAIHIPVVESRVQDHIGYLHIQDFSSGDLPSQVRSALEDLQRQDAQALVLDLRGNPGGRLDVGTRIAGYLMPPETPIYDEISEHGQVQTVLTTGGQIWTKPIDVLIDDGTASMGEILAAALQEERGAKLFGQQTAGAVAASVVLPLKDGSAIQVTVQRIDSADGTVLNNVGIAPDVPIQDGVSENEAVVDQALVAAQADLRQRIGATAASNQPATSVVSPPR
jgi:carboxyl-terminal processing protease